MSLPSTPAGIGCPAGPFRRAVAAVLDVTFFSYINQLVNQLALRTAKPKVTTHHSECRVKRKEPKRMCEIPGFSRDPCCPNQVTPPSNAKGCTIKWNNVQE
eukprot:TRINITY_DN986_c0_g2_i4.p1 TRINITY_DN986_c0_g2~~TRINITY_DN986_c0_g2_i4.p1  ORF type:complete len:101 (-),score=7.20 TRINITY_DN986_c0_g2_i4:102-404(-)